MTTIDYTKPASFRIGRVFGDSFAVFGRNIILCVGLAVIFSGIPTFLMQWWMLNTVGTATPEDLEQFSASAVLFSLGGGIFLFVLSSILQAGLTRASIEDLNGERPNFGDCLGTAFSTVLPILGIAFLVGLGVSLGMVALLVPGIFLWIYWSVAIPVQVNEKLGVLGSMTRSGELTKGSRWAIFGLQIIFAIIVFAIQFALGLLTTLAASTAGPVVALIMAALLSTVWTVALSIVAAVAYLELRLVKEGTDVKDLAEIFA